MFVIDNYVVHITFGVLINFEYIVFDVDVSVIDGIVK